MRVVASRCIVLLLLVSGPLLAAQQMPKNNPNGVWESATGTRYNFQLTGTELKVTLVEGSNPTYLKYEVTMKNDPEEINTYKGDGYFVAKLSNGKECRFDTEWMVIVIRDTFLTGGATNIIPDPETCAVKEKQQVRLELNKK
jgi:hypothetical protein